MEQQNSIRCEVEKPIVSLCCFVKIKTIKTVKKKGKSFSLVAAGNSFELCVIAEENVMKKYSSVQKLFSFIFLVIWAFYAFQSAPLVIHHHLLYMLRMSSIKF